MMMNEVEKVEMVVFVVCASDAYEPGWEGIFATREAAQAYIDSFGWGEESLCIIEDTLR